ncbi:holo-ACP synthase [Planctomycetota bacterium]
MIVGIGTDILEIERMRDLLARHGDHFLERIFCEGEREYCQGTADPAVHYAARFAAKEAVLKVLGTGWGQGIRWRDIEVARNDNGDPSILLHGKAAGIATGMNIDYMHLSLSHGKKQAIATAVGEQRA